MNKTQQSLHQLIQNKRDQLREILRQNDQRKVFEEKRTQNQQNSKSSIISFDSKITIRRIEEIDSESDQKEEEIIRLTKFKTQKNLTFNYLNQIVEYLDRMPSSYQISRIFYFCEEALLDKKLISSQLVPILTEILFKLIKHKHEILICQPIFLLFNAFQLHQDYVILQYIKMYLLNNQKEKQQIINYLQQPDIPFEENLLRIISINEKYANFEMMLFLCETIRNQEFFQAIEFYGAKILCEQNRHKKEYKKVILKILQITGWELELNEDIISKDQEENQQNN
ncbi:unnamed protein product [Paramecium sonneborni]|uniref:Uncharacterized protein n=1 Tax=Paramecium sonneborni TaxID=65129 RepID=A0A8S1K8W3_9CILI|nr:unnamed protein product [Paramecium sonneborni]